MPVGKIFVGYDSDSAPYALIEQLEIDDLASDATLPLPLVISSYSISSSVIRSKSDISFSFVTNTTGVLAGSAVSLDFPDQYGPVLRTVTAPLVEITKSGSTVVTTI